MGELGQVVAGIDEVGRGCLAGPVVACAVVLDERIPGVMDSKCLRPKERTRLAGIIRQKAQALGIGVVGQRVVDRINILQATFMAMAMAVGRLSLPPSTLLIDGKFEIPLPTLTRFWTKHNQGNVPEQVAVVDGDAKIYAIAAASIVAKVYRDQMMVHFDSQWPVYGFARHMGYGTSYHRAMLVQHGPCPLHRRSFRGVVCERTQGMHGGEE
ncbi:MAG: ribonuclease HII [Desulfovibrio sp.]|nr:ribonuclease HII [Desulfovibrio sp.]